MNDFYYSFNQQDFKLEKIDNNYLLRTDLYTYCFQNHFKTFDKVLSGLKAKRYNLDLSNALKMEIHLLQELAKIGALVIRGKINNSPIQIYFKSSNLPQLSKKRPRAFTNIYYSESESLKQIEIPPLNLKIVLSKSSDASLTILQNQNLKLLLSSFDYPSKKMNQIDGVFYSHVNHNVLNSKVGVKTKLNNQLIPKKLSAPRNKQIGNDFKAVLEKRRSHRASNKSKLSEDSLSELLYEVFRKTPAKDYPNKIKGIYPSAGGFYEIFPVIEVYQHETLERGLYTVKITGKKVSYQKVDTRPIRRPTYVNITPKVVIHLIGDLTPLETKYEGVPLKLLYQNSGVIISYLYLFSTFLNLPSVAHGAENSSYPLEKLFSVNDGLLNVGQFILV